MPRTTILGSVILRMALPAVLFCLAGAAPARAEISVTPAGKGYDIAITGQASAAELVDAITHATGASVKGQPEDATLGANTLHGVSLERALSKLLPASAFAVRYGDDGRPLAIIFLTSDSSGSEFADGVDPSATGMDDLTTTDGDMNGGAMPDGSNGGDPNQPPQ